MLVVVKKSFPYSTNGITQHTASASEEAQEIPDRLIPSLIADGYIEAPDGHPPVAMTPHRRTGIIDRVVALFRAHVEGLTDERLLEMADLAEQQAADAAERHQPDQEDLFNGADPAAFDHDNDGKPGGSLKLDGLAAIAEVDLSKLGDQGLEAFSGLSEALLFDVLYRNPHTGEQLASKGLTKELAETRAADLATMEEPAADIRIVPHVAEGAQDDQAAQHEGKIDPDTADEATLRAFLTTRDGKEPDKRFGVDRLRALAKTAPAAEGASE